MAKGIKRLLKIAKRNVNHEIEVFSRQGGIYARGLAREGYKGGYLQALCDVELALNGVLPTTNHWWEKRKK